MEQSIDGSCLDHVVKSDITEWGIKHFKHRSLLYESIVNLKNGVKQQDKEGANNTQII